MKIIHVINTLSAGGAELHLLALCRCLKREGIDVLVATLRDRVKGSRSLRREFESEGIRVVSFGANSRFDTRFPVALARLIRHEQPALLHSHLPRADFAAALVRLLCSRVVWVCSVHGIYNETWSAGWMMPLFNHVWRRADTLVAISHGVKQWLIEKRRLRTGRIEVCHYGIEPSEFSSPKNDLRKAWGLERRILVGSMGRLELGKGYDCLIRAMARLRSEIPDILLLIAGHDPWGYGKQLRVLIDRLGLEDHVRLVGFQADIPSFIGALDLFAFASRSEGFGQVLIEAMAAGKPVVAGRIAPFTEIVVDGETGLLVELVDPEAFAKAMLSLLSDRDKALQMGKRGRVRVNNHFSIQRETRQMLDLYKKLTAPEARVMATQTTTYKQ